MNIKRLIAAQKAEARKVIASDKIDVSESIDGLLAKAFLEHDFGAVKTVDDLMEAIHTIKHQKSSKAKKHTRCKICRALRVELEQQTPIADILPKYGNLISVLEQEAAQQKAKVESKKNPSQNDLTRWALLDAVLAYYQGLEFQSDRPIVESRYDNRLIDELAPDFDVIARIWLDKLDELSRRNDQFTLNRDEIDKAETDLAEGMRGSAFEKALDRYRIDFMAKLPK